MRLRYFQKYHRSVAVILNVLILSAFVLSQINLSHPKSLNNSCNIDSDCHHKWHFSNNHKTTVWFHKQWKAPTFQVFAFETPVKEICFTYTTHIKNELNKFHTTQTLLRGPPCS